MYLIQNVWSKVYSTNTVKINADSWLVLSVSQWWIVGVQRRLPWQTWCLVVMTTARCLGRRFSTSAERTPQTVRHVSYINIHTYIYKIYNICVCVVGSYSCGPSGEWISSESGTRDRPTCLPGDTCTTSTIYCIYIYMYIYTAHELYAYKQISQCVLVPQQYMKQYWPMFCLRVAVQPAAGPPALCPLRWSGSWVVAAPSRACSPGRFCSVWRICPGSLRTAGLAPGPCCPRPGSWRPPTSSGPRGGTPAWSPWPPNTSRSVSLLLSLRCQ